MSNEKKVTVIALGGNAILQPGQRGTFAEQMKNVETTCQQLAQMVESGKYKIIITHGNGPQVGNILLQNETAKDVAATMPLYVCGAESQGLIGYMMQQTLHNLLVDKGKGGIPIATVVTQVVVDKNDQAFQNPTNRSARSTPRKKRRNWSRKRDITSRKTLVAAGGESFHLPIRLRSSRRKRCGSSSMPARSSSLPVAAGSLFSRRERS